MKKNFYYLLIIASLNFFIPACSSNDEASALKNEEQTILDKEHEEGEQQSSEDIANNPRKDITLSRSEKELATLNTEFAFRFLQIANEELENRSILISPQSASFALSMLSNGANGETQNEIKEVLGYEKFTQDEINGYNQKLMKNLVELDKTSTMSIANSLWLDDEFSVRNAYQQVLQDAYEAKIFVEDFTQRSTMSKINQWCSNKTNGCIPNFLKDWNEKEKIVLVNALYFKGKWLMPFEKNKTEKGIFTTIEDVSENIDFMRQTANNWYVKDENVAVSEFPYGNGAFSMYIVLPHEGVSLDEWIKTFDATLWNTMQTKMEIQKMNIWLPKFKLELYMADKMTYMLHTMGIVKAFDAKEADFSALSDENIWIDSIMQATYINIDEEGTESASVTGNGWISADLGEEENNSTIDFRANRPFLFILQEKSTKAILFFGKFGGAEE